MPLLTTRIYKPLLDSKVLIRKRLIDQFVKEDSCPLTLVIANAGYGKSILVSQALEFTRKKFCWISLQDDCNDERTFLSYLSKAVTDVYPDSLANVTDALNAEILPPVDTLTTLLINELCNLQGPINIVLDDYHCIQQQSIHNIINEALKYPVEQFKFTIISRFEPPLNINLLNANGKLHDIRAIDLLFTTDEIIQLAKQWKQINLSINQAETIRNISEGWIVVIRLIINQLVNGDTVLEALANLTGKREVLTDYLFSELLNQQPEIAHEYILAAALFDRFNLDLLQSLEFQSTSEKGNIRTILESIIQKAIFVFPLDDDKNWYRYHHVIQQYLRNHFYEVMDENIIQNTYLKAIDYFETNSLWEEAIDCALMAKNISKAVSVIETHYTILIETDQFARLEGWLNKLPSGIIEKNMVLLLIRAFLADSSKNFNSMGNDLEGAHKIITKRSKIKPVPSKIMAEFYTIKSCYLFYTGHIDDSLYLARQAIETFQNEPCYMRDFALCYLSMGLTLCGKVESAIDTINSILDSHTSLPEEEIMRLEILKVIAFAMSGKISQLIKPATLVLRISHSIRHWVTNSMANYYLAATHYMQNNLNKVAALFQNVKLHRFAGRPFWVIHMYFFEAKRLLANGEFEGLTHLLEELHLYSKNFESSSFNNLAVTIDLEIALALGNKQKVMQLLPDVDFNSVLLPVYFYTPQLTQIKLGLQYPTFFPPTETKFIIDSFIEKCTSIHCFHLLVQTYPLLCTWHLKFGKREDALSSLTKAVEYGRQNMFVRPLLESDETVLDLIKENYANELGDPFIAMIFELINFMKLSGGATANLITLTHSPVKDKFGFNENEVKILELSARGLRIKEIAEELHLSAGTIKTYLYNIYKKMDVPNRAGALAKLKVESNIHSGS